MRSRATIGNHPLHPALVALPIGAFFLVLVADLACLNNHRAFWAEMSGVALAMGVIGALGAAGWLGGKMDFELRAGVVEPQESGRERS